MTWQYPIAGTPSTGAAGGDLTGVYPNPTIGAGKVTGAKIAAGTVTLANLIGTLPYLKVQTGVPVAFSSPFVLDNTAITGDLYGWDGTAYVKAAALPT